MFVCMFVYIYTHMYVCVFFRYVEREREAHSKVVLSIMTTICLWSGNLLNMWRPPAADGFISVAKPHRPRKDRPKQQKNPPRVPGSSQQHSVWCTRWEGRVRAPDPPRPLSSWRYTGHKSLISTNFVHPSAISPFILCIYTYTYISGLQTTYKVGYASQ